MQYSFTFHHVSIKTSHLFFKTPTAMGFTFHHVSIKTQGELETN